jgi:hypothetical protein
MRTATGDDAQGNYPNEMRCLSSLAASSSYTANTCWSSGTYAYDGSGTIKTIGTAAYTYDKVSRLVASTLYDGPTGGGNPKDLTGQRHFQGRVASLRAELLSPN